MSVFSQQAPAPTNLASQDTTGSYTHLTWDEPTDANGVVSGYNVYRCQGAGCTPVWLAWVQPNWHNYYSDSSLSAGTTYRYAVGSSRGSGTESAWSNTITVTTLTQAPQPTGLRVTDDRGLVSLRWTASTGDGLLGYNVYRCDATAVPACNPEWKVWVDGRTTTTYTDRDVTEGTTYRYAVGSSRGSGTESAWSNQVTALVGPPPPPPPPSKPTGLTVTSVSAEAVSLRWKSSSGSDEGAGYGVYRCTVPEGESTCEPYDDLWLAYLENTNTYTDTEVTPGETYRYQVAADNLQRENLSRAVTVTVGAQMPETVPSPTGLTVTETTESRVRLSWTAPEDDGKGPIQAIDIYRCNVDRSPGCSEFLHLTSRNPALTEFRDRDVEPDTTYRYAIASYRSAKEVSPWSNQVTASTQSPVPAAPTGLTVTSTSETEIALSWTAPDGVVDAYNVFRCEEGKKACVPEWYKWLDGGRTTTFTDTELSAGTQYRYAVEAIRYNRSTSPWTEYKSPWSNQVTAVAEAGAEPPAEGVQAPAPTGLTVTSSSATAIGLSWTAPADDGHGELYGYNVFRCEEGQTACEPQWIAWVDGGANTTYTDDGSADPDDDGAPIGLTAGATYRYAVGASRGQGTESPWSNQVTATTEGETDPKPPVVDASAPTNLTVTAAGEDGISLSWTAPASETNVRGYNVFRCVSPCTLDSSDRSSWLAWVTQGDGDPHPAPTQYTDADVTSGTTYVYAVEAEVNDDYVRSAWSNQVTAVAEAGAEPPAEGVQAPAPTGLTVTSSSATAIGLSWTAPADDGHGELYGYNVFRCEEGQTACEPQWIAWVDGGANTTYTDDGSADPDDDGAPIGLTAGATYRYAVGASRGQGTESPWSNQVVATARASEPAPVGPSPEDRAMTLESGLATLGRTMAGQAVDSLSGRFASLSSSSGTRTAASLRPDTFSGVLKMAAEQMGIPMAVADINDVVHAGPEWGPWMSDRDLLSDSCLSTVSGCPEDTDGNLVAGSLTLRQLWSQNSFQMALGESDDGSAPAWTLWGRGSISGFEGQPRDGLDLDGELVSGFLGLDYRWGTDTLLGVAVSHSQGDIDYGEADNGPGELETTLRSVYPYAYWSPRPGLGLWGVLGYGFGETALTDVTANNLETDVEMWMAALGGRSDLFRVGRVDLALKADAFTVRLESDKAEALKSTDVDSSRVRLALEGRTSLAISGHSQLTPRLELGTRWDTGDAETGLGAELGGALAYTNTRLGLSVEASGRYLLTHEEETFEEWGASLAACMSSGTDGTGLALSLMPVWGNAASGVDALWGTDGGARVGATALTSPHSASWQPDRLDLGLRYGSETPRGLLSPFGEVGLQGSDNYSMRVGTQLDTATGWKLDVFGGHVSRQAETADNLVGLTASYGFGATATNQAFAGAMLATSNWSTCDTGPAQKISTRPEPVMRRQETAGTQPDEDTDNGHNPATGDNRTITAVARETGMLSRESSRTAQEPHIDRVIVPQQTEEAGKWFIPVTGASGPATVVAQRTDETSEPTSESGAEKRPEETGAVSRGFEEVVAGEAVSGSIEEITVKGIRRSLKDALEVKRSSEHVVEALSLEDIDALPNVTIAEALVRLPGVNGTRDRGNQSQATIRGLGPRMVLGTVNGREVASAEPSRNIRWEQYPSELISQVQVYKTQSADLVAGGIAGTVNLETVAPLDHNGPKYTFNGVGAYYEGGEDLPKYSEWGNKLSGSLVKTFNKKVGIALGVASQKQKNAFPSYQGWGFNSPGSWQPDFPADGGDLDGMGTTGFVPWGTQIEVGKMNTDRIGLLGTLQFRPSDAIDIRYDALYSEFDMNIEQDQTWYQGTGNINNLQAGHYSDVVVVDGLALAATAQSPVPGCIHSPDGSEPPSIPQCFDIRHVLSLYDQKNSVFTQGLDLEFSGESITVDADISYSRAERNNYWHGLYIDDRNATFRYDFRGTPSVSVPAGSPSARPETAELIVVDCNTGFCGTLNGNENQGSELEDESWSYQLNINKALDAGHLSSIDLGIRYSDRKKEVIWEQFKMPRGGNNPAQILPDGFISYNLSALDTSPVLTAPSFMAAANLFGGIDFSLAEIDEDRYWKVYEENLAGYVKANFEGSIGSSSYYTANVGLRVVDVGTESFGLSGAAIGNDYTEVLPSASINFFLDEENIIRLSASRAISRPPLDELRVGKIINAPAGNIEGNTGNPSLDPFISKQLDLSYEWYFAPESLAAATVYYKKIDDYIGYDYLDFEVKDGRIFYIYGPTNEQEGNIRGIELTFQAPYTSLLPKALEGVSAGIYSNYAYADSNIKELYPADNPYSLAGLAKHTATVDLWFWWRKFDLRFGWKYHSAFTTGFGWDGSELSTLDAESNFSASLAYILKDNITLRVQGYNLTDEPARSSRNNDVLNLRRFDKYGRAYFFGVSWKMW